jgi:hypothetical protein
MDRSTGVTYTRYRCCIDKWCSKFESPWQSGNVTMREAASLEIAPGVENRQRLIGDAVAIYWSSDENDKKLGGDYFVNLLLSHLSGPFLDNSKHNLEPRLQ